MGIRCQPQQKHAVWHSWTFARSLWVASRPTHSRDILNVISDKAWIVVYFSYLICVWRSFCASSTHPPACFHFLSPWSHVVKTCHMRRWTWHLCASNWHLITPSSFMLTLLASKQSLSLLANDCNYHRWFLHSMIQNQIAVPSAPLIYIGYSFYEKIYSALRFWCVFTTNRDIRAVTLFGGWLTLHACHARRVSLPA